MLSPLEDTHPTQEFCDGYRLLQMAPGAVRLLPPELQPAGYHVRLLITETQRLLGGRSLPPHLAWAELSAEERAAVAIIPTSLSGAYVLYQQSVEAFGRYLAETLKHTVEALQEVAGVMTWLDRVAEQEEHREQVKAATRRQWRKPARPKRRPAWRR